MELKILEKPFTICKVPDLTQVDYSDAFLFIGKTDEEISLVCQMDSVPANAFQQEGGWQAFRIQGILDFSLIGILAKISMILAEQQIGIFVLSTFHTDYVLTKAESFEKAIRALQANGYSIQR